MQNVRRKNYYSTIACKWVLYDMKHFCLTLVIVLTSKDFTYTRALFSLFRNVEKSTVIYIIYKRYFTLPYVTSLRDSFCLGTFAARVRSKIMHSLLCITS